jgi:hypothetical protein
LKISEAISILRSIDKEIDNVLANFEEPDKIDLVAHYQFVEKKKKPVDVCYEVGFENLSHFSYAFDGCFVLFNQAENEFIKYNPELCDTGYIPASTFKIPHSLIALEEGAIKDANQVQSR